MSRPPIDQAITFCYTEDGPATWRFYEDVIGLRLAVDQGSCRIYHLAGRAYLGFCERAGRRATEGIILTIVTDAVDEWADHLTQQGVGLARPPAHNPEYGIYHFFLRDPNGYLIEVQRFDDVHWADTAGPPPYFALMLWTAATDVDMLAALKGTAPQRYPALPARHAAGG